MSLAAEAGCPSPSRFSSECTVSYASKHSYTVNNANHTSIVAPDGAGAWQSQSPPQVIADDKSYELEFKSDSVLCPTGLPKFSRGIASSRASPSYGPRKEANVNLPPLEFSICVSGIFLCWRESRPRQLVTDSQTSLARNKKLHTGAIHTSLSSSSSP